MGVPKALTSDALIREVYPGSSATSPDAEYVVLQLRTPDQAVEGRELRLYPAQPDEEADGTFIPSAIHTIGHDSGLFLESERRVHLATSEASAAGAGTPDYKLPSVDHLDPDAGAVCYTASGGGTPADCVTWGDFPGSTSSESRRGPWQVCGNNASEGTKRYFELPSGSHTFGVYATDNAGNEDPTAATHAFRVDSELRDFKPPGTTITSAPFDPSFSPRATFGYSSSEPGSTFECRVDDRDFQRCLSSGYTTPELANGTHTFQVRGTDSAGNQETVPASFTWQIQAPLPRARFAVSPQAVSFFDLSALRRCRVLRRPVLRKRCRRVILIRSLPVLSARFASDAEAVSYRCRIDSGAYRPCREAIGFRRLPGRHRLDVFAVDHLGNQGPPARQIFRVILRRAHRGQTNGGERKSTAESAWGRRPAYEFGGMSGP